jgi:hypothetical protein
MGWFRDGDRGEFAVVLPGTPVYGTDRDIGWIESKDDAGDYFLAACGEDRGATVDHVAAFAMDHALVKGPAPRGVPTTSEKRLELSGIGVPVNEGVKSYANGAEIRERSVVFGGSACTWIAIARTKDGRSAGEFFANSFSVRL